MEAEAKRLAVQVRVLLYDAPGGRKNRSVSLLTQLGIRDHIPWLDTAIAPDPSWTHDFSCGLCRLHGEGKGPDMKMSYAAPLDDVGPDRQHPPAAFIDWWTEPVLADRLGHEFSREDFVRYLADQDGGAHVDAELEESYKALTRLNSMQIVSGGGMLGFNIPTPPDDDQRLPGPPGSSIALTSVRQIAHETRKTIECELDLDGSAGVTIRSPICALPIKTKIEVGRNDACPCGSGLKAKKCFAMRGTRRPRVTNSAAIAMS